VSDINRLCAIFCNNPYKSYKPRDFKAKEQWNYNSVKKQLRRLTEYGIIKCLSHGEYILADRDRALMFLEPNSDKNRWASQIIPPHRIRAKAHNLSVGIIDMSGEPLEWMLKFNMLTKPGKDYAQNVGLRDGQAKKFNIRISLRNGNALIYPRKKGWESELLNMFSWCGDFIKRFDDINENMEIAINYEDVQRLDPSLANIPFEAVQGIELYHNGQHIQLCRSQFKEGEFCIRSGSIDETMSLAEKVTKDLSQAMKEVSFEKRMKGDIEAIKQSLDELPRVIALTISPSIKDAVKEGIIEGFNELSPIKSEDRKDMTYR